MCVRCRGTCIRWTTVRPLPLYGKNSHTGLGKVKFLAAEAAREGEKSDEGASAVNVESNMDAEAAEATKYGYL